MKIKNNAPKTEETEEIMSDDEIRKALRDPIKREKAFDLLIRAGLLVVTPDMRERCSAAAGAAQGPVRWCKRA